MKEKARELRQKAVEKAAPLLVQLANEGMSAGEIKALGKSIIQSFVSQMYSDRQQGHVKWTMDALIRSLEGKKLDSTAEGIMYRDLMENGIRFDHQVEIGSYRIDFLIYPGLVIELDGPHHNQPDQIEYDTKRDGFLEKLGYCVLRIPVDVYATVPEEVIETIRIYQSDQK